MCHLWLQGAMPEEKLVLFTNRPPKGDRSEGFDMKIQMFMDFGCVDIVDMAILKFWNLRQENEF